MADLASADMLSEVMTAFASYWAGRTQIASPNDRFETAKVPSGASWIAWQIQGDAAPATRLSHSVERNHYIHRGTITFTISSPLRTGMSVALGYADAIRHWLEAVVLATVFFEAPSTPLDLGDDGAWHQVSVTAPWVYLADRPSTLT